MVQPRLLQLGQSQREGGLPALLGDGTKYGIELHNSVLIYTEGVTLANPDATLNMSKANFARLLMGGQQAPSDAAKVSGNSQKVVELFSMLDRFDPMFNIVTP